MPDKEVDLNWHILIPAGVDVERSGILEWEIEGAGSYVVRSKKMRRAMEQYEQNVRNLHAGLPHSTGRFDFRRIHVLLRDALVDGRSVSVRALENCDEADLAARKRHWTELRGTLNAMK